MRGPALNNAHTQTVGRGGHSWKQWHSRLTPCSAVAVVQPAHNDAKRWRQGEQVIAAAGEQQQPLVCFMLDWGPFM